MRALGDVIGADALSVALYTFKVSVVQVLVSVAMPAIGFSGNLFFAPPRGDRVLGRAIALLNGACSVFWQLAKLALVIGILPER